MTPALRRTGHRRGHHGVAEIHSLHGSCHKTGKIAGEIELDGRNTYVRGYDRIVLITKIDECMADRESPIPAFEN